MVVARASGMDLASILRQNTFLTLGVRPAGVGGLHKSTAAFYAPHPPWGVGRGRRLKPPRRGAHKCAQPPRKCINLGVGGGWVRLKPPAPPPTQKKGGCTALPTK